MPPDLTDPRIMKALLAAQRGEITEHLTYRKIASVTQDPKNRAVLEQISADELDHYLDLEAVHPGEEIAPDRVAAWTYYLMARILGITFTLKLMEGVEQRAQAPPRSFAPRYRRLVSCSPGKRSTRGN